MPKDVLVVFTWRPMSLILEEGGSQAWTLKPENARRCTYIVCTRNRYHEGADQMVPHGAAFLIGKIKGIEQCPRDPDNTDEAARYLVRISEYAEIDKHSVWPGNRMPFWYVDGLSTLGIDPTTLNWRQMPDYGQDDEPTPPKLGPSGPTNLSIAEAKRGLAATFGVSADNIEITIRG